MSNADVERAIRAQLASIRAQQQAAIEQFSVEFAALTNQEVELTEEIQRKEAILLRLEEEVQQLERGCGAEVTSPTRNSTKPLPTAAVAQAAHAPHAVSAVTQNAPSQSAPLVAKKGIVSAIGIAIVEFDEGRSKVR
jgi:hypothetical protein